MKITKSKLEKIIKEELGKVLKERKDVEDVQVGDYIEVVAPMGEEAYVNALDSKDDYNNSVSFYMPFKALVQVVAVSKHGEG